MAKLYGTAFQPGFSDKYLWGLIAGFSEQLKVVAPERNRYTQTQQRFHVDVSWKLACETALQQSTPIVLVGFGTTSLSKRPFSFIRFLSPAPLALCVRNLRHAASKESK